MMESVCVIHFVTYCWDIESTGAGNVLCGCERYISLFSLLLKQTEVLNYVLKRDREAWGKTLRKYSSLCIGLLRDVHRNPHFALFWILLSLAPKQVPVPKVPFGGSCGRSCCSDNENSKFPPWKMRERKASFMVRTVAQKLLHCSFVCVLVIFPRGHPSSRCVWQYSFYRRGQVFCENNEN